MLNEAQQRAVSHGVSPLLIIAGAGSGKTNTLAHRVARLLMEGADPRRVLLLTFSRRAAAEMTARAQKISPAAGGIVWSGTFHAVGNRVLRLHAPELGLDPSFTVLDRSDSADLMDVVRHQLGLSKGERRFPKKGTCLAIYSRVVNCGGDLAATLKEFFPWCLEHRDELKRLFAAYVETKQQHHVLDYDDLLLYWAQLMGEPSLAARVRGRFDHMLVDEYQDTNVLQAQILGGLAPDGRGLTVVGDDAQSIYSFRAATVRNILDFPRQFGAEVITLEENYRSTQPILDAANAVIEKAEERFTKNLFSRRVSPQPPWLVTAEDEAAQVDYVVSRVLAAREGGIALKKQAVLFRTAHHSDALEVELARRNIPFVKYGGLKFLEAAHVKDTLCVLRMVENVRDLVAAFRVLQLLPGIGPAIAQQAHAALATGGEFTAPAAARNEWPQLCELVQRLRNPASLWPSQMGMVRRWYQPHLERIYDHAQVRAQDLEQLELIAGNFPSRERFLTEITLDPPQSTGDHAGPPLLDEDYLILSTIHSAKGQEWDVVFVLNATDGCIPSDMATESPEQIEEERRLLYVAMTRARDELHVIHPQRYYVTNQRRYGDAHMYAPRTRFITDGMLERFDRVTHGRAMEMDPAPARVGASLDVAAKMRTMWA